MSKLRAEQLTSELTSIVNGIFGKSCVVGNPNSAIFRNKYSSPTRIPHVNVTYRKYSTVLSALDWTGLDWTGLDGLDWTGL